MTLWKYLVLASPSLTHFDLAFWCTNDSFLSNIFQKSFTRSLLLVSSASQRFAFSSLRSNSLMFTIRSLHCLSKSTKYFEFQSLIPFFNPYFLLQNLSWPSLHSHFIFFLQANPYLVCFKTYSHIIFQQLP